MTNFVSIVTPAYNSAATIAETMRSVQDQTHPLWEMLIVTDLGTVDNTREVVSQFSSTDSRIKLIDLKNGRGLATARNEALKQAKGEFVSFLDSDDLWDPTKLEKQIAFMRRQNVAFSCHEYSHMDVEGRPLGVYIQTPDVITYHDLLKNNTIGCLTVMINQTQTGPIRMELNNAEDFHTWLGLLKRGFTCHGLKANLAKYRIVPKSGSRNKLKMIRVRWQVYRKHEKLSIPYSLYLMVHYGASYLTKTYFH